jgi:hypothetical protein
LGIGVSGRAAGVVAAVALAAGLAACASDGGGSGKLADVLKTGGTDPKGQTFSSDYFTKPSYCPPIQIRAGTESLALYEKGHEGDATFVRLQAAMGKTARECSAAGGAYSIKIGVSGRVVAGPKGTPGTVIVPLRIAVARQMVPGPLYTQLFKIPVTVDQPTLAADFSQVIDQVNLQVGPEDRDLIIYIGFDDGKPPKKPEQNPTG